MLKDPLKSKIFRATATDRLDEDINAWFAKHPDIEIVKMQSYGGSLDSHTFIVHFVTQIIYREPVSSGVLKDGSDA